MEASSENGGDEYENNLERDIESGAGTGAYVPEPPPRQESRAQNDDMNDEEGEKQTPPVLEMTGDSEEEYSREQQSQSHEEDNTLGSRTASETQDLEVGKHEGSPVTHGDGALQITPTSLSIFHHQEMNSSSRESEFSEEVYGRDEYSEDDDLEECEQCCKVFGLLCFLAFMPLQGAIVYAAIRRSDDLLMLIACSLALVFALPWWYTVNSAILDQRRHTGNSKWGVCEIALLVVGLPLVLFIILNLLEHFLVERLRRGIRWVCLSCNRYILTPVGDGVAFGCLKCCLGLVWLCTRLHDDVLVPFGFILRAAWRWVYGEFLEPVGRCIRWVCCQFYEYILVPIGKGIRCVCMGIYQYILSPIGKGIRLFCSEFFSCLEWTCIRVYEYIVKPSGQMIRWICNQFYDYMLLPVGIGVRWVCRHLSECIKRICTQVYLYVLKPVGLGIRWVWRSTVQYILAPIGAAISWFCSLLGQGVQFACSFFYNNVMTPIGRAFYSIYNTFAESIRRITGRD